MKKTILALIAFFGLPAFGQTILLNTTVSAAATSSQKVITLASATGINAPSTTNPNLNTYLVIDAEMLSVQAVNGTQITVTRGINGSRSMPHASGAITFVVPAYLATRGFGPYIKAGSCTRGNEIVLPQIAVLASGAINIADCVGGQWVNGDAVQTTRATQWRIGEPETGAQASTAVFGTNTTSVLDSLYCSEVDIPYGKLVTGLGIHVGTTGNSSDLWVIGLYDSSGILIANSATAGTAPGAAYSWSAFPFTSKYYVVGPGQYFGCMIPISTTTATVDTITTGKGANRLTYGATSSTAALPASFTAPTTFTNVVGPYFYVY